MPDSPQAHADKLRASIDALETQRAVLGDAVVETALAALRQQLAALESQPPAEASPSEQRRVITIWFADVVGSTALAAAGDPEEWRQTLARLHTTLGEIVTRRRGTVAQYLGDGLLAFFGVPQASEADPENAIRAALEAQPAVASLGARHAVQVRLGIHTGLVVVGELGAEFHKEVTATGDAMNLAGRLQAAAPPGGILISHDTYRYVRGIFDVTPMPPLTVRGKSETIQTYLVRRAKPRAFRTGRRGVAGVQTRTIGREGELEQLHSDYLDAYGRRGVVWTQLVGEAGVGKSRLLDEMQEWLDLRPETCLVLRARAYAGDIAQPFGLIRRLWFDRFQIPEDLPLPQAEVKWVQRFQELARTAEVEPAHALGLLVGLPFNDSPHLAGLRANPAHVKGRAVVVSRALLKAMRQEAQVVMLLEDLQWADPSSWEYLQEIVTSPALAPQAGEVPARHGLFVLATARPDWSPPAELTADRDSRTGLAPAPAAPEEGTGEKTPSLSPGETRREAYRYVRMPLPPLSPEATRELVQELIQCVECMPEEVIQLVATRSEGVPYYAEELVNWFVDRGIIDKSREPWRFMEGRLRETPLPATLQHLLLTRLSALSDVERAALQRGAIYGRNFWTGGVEALGVPGSDAVLWHLLPRGLVQAEPESSFEGEREWSFYHSMLRDVTYESVLKRERAGLHRAAARWLEDQARQAGRLDEFAGLLGEHAERAGDLLAAADWYQRAAEGAFKQTAFREARRFVNRALDLLPPVERERRWTALNRRFIVAAVLGETENQRTDLAELRALATESGDDCRMATVYLLQCELAGLSGSIQEETEAAEQALAAARRAGDAKLELKAQAHLIWAGSHHGESPQYGPQLEALVAQARVTGDQEALLPVLRVLGTFYAYTEDYARATEILMEQIELVRGMHDRGREASLLGDLGFSYLRLGLYKQARAAVEESLQFNRGVGGRAGAAINLLNLGGICWLSGDHRTARRDLEQAWRESESIGNAFSIAASLNALARVLEDTGDPAAALRRYGEAHDIFKRSGQAARAQEALVGAAHCELAQGKLEPARQHAAEVWEYMGAHGGAGMAFPIRAYGVCADLFDALGDAETTRAIVEAGYRELMTMADKISVPEWRKAFLENDPFNRGMVELSERWAARV